MCLRLCPLRAPFQIDQEVISPRVSQKCNRMRSASLERLQESERNMERAEKPERWRRSGTVSNWHGERMAREKREKNTYE